MALYETDGYDKVVNPFWDNKDNAGGGGGDFPSPTQEDEQYFMVAEWDDDEGKVIPKWAMGTAAEVKYNRNISQLQSRNVQDAIDELASRGGLPIFDDSNEGDCLVIRETSLNVYEPVWYQIAARNVKFSDPLQIYGQTNVQGAIDKLESWRDTIFFAEYAEYDSSNDSYNVTLGPSYPTFQLADYTDLDIEFAFSSVEGTSTKGLVVSGSEIIGCNNIPSLIDGKSEAQICIRKAVKIGASVAGYIDITLALDTSGVDFEHDLTTVSLTGVSVEYDLTKNGTPVTGDITRENEIKINITGKHSKLALLN